MRFKTGFFAFLLLSCSGPNGFISKSDRTQQKSDDAADATGNVDGKASEAPNEAATEQTAAQAANSSSSAEPGPVADSVAKPIMQAGGVPGGHFDLDTSTKSYPFNSGTTDRHVHEYDEKFSVTGVDYFKLLDPKFISPAKALAPDQNFKIIIANAQLSPGARLTINDKTYAVADWQKRTQRGDLPIFSMSGAAGTQKLTALAISFDPIKSIAGQLIPTETNLVRANAPGPNNSYRAGALTIQMIDAKTTIIDAALGIAQIGSSGMLWESTLFYHFKTSDAEHEK